MACKFLEFRGAEALPLVDQIAALRMRVFSDWPYLYDGDLAYEKKYLKNYFDSEKSFIAVALDGDKVVGASTAIWLPHTEEAFQKPFVEQAVDVSTVCYYGESVLLAEYRGGGVGGWFMHARENFARSLTGVTTAAFCAVVRSPLHPAKPADYRSLDGFWRKVGFVPHEKMLAYFSWRDHGDLTDTEKPLQFWLKNIKDTSNEKRGG